jgi:hypothetical protein
MLVHGFRFALACRTLFMSLALFIFSRFIYLLFEKEIFVEDMFPDSGHIDFLTSLPLLMRNLILPALNWSLVWCRLPIELRFT